MTVLPRKIVLALLAVGLAVLWTVPALAAKDVPLMTKEELQSRLEKGDVVILDVRKGRDWDSSEFKIQGAQRPETKDVAAWAGQYAKDQTIVIY